MSTFVLEQREKNLTEGLSFKSMETKSKIKTGKRVNRKCKSLMQLNCQLLGKIKGSE